MNGRRHLRLAAAVGLSVAGSLVLVRGTPVAQTSVRPSAMPRLAIIDERYQSYNVEMAEVIGGNFWKPYDRGSLAKRQAGTPGAAEKTTSQKVGQDPSMFEARPPIDLSNRRLRTLAAALGPAYVRTSGSWANQVYFHDSDAPPPTKAPSGFDGILTRQQWKGVIDFARAVNAKLVTSFTISAGVRDSAGVWMPDHARTLVTYTKAAGGEIAAAEFFNEPDMPSYGGAPAKYNASSYARDFAVFHSFAKVAVPNMQIVGPGTVIEGVLLPAAGATGLAAAMIRTEDMLSAEPRPFFDIFSYHMYGAASIRCASMGADGQTTAEAALSEEWLSRTDRAFAFYAPLRDRFQPGKPIWITETADAACGGNPWATTFLDSFRYLDQLGRLARRGVAAVFHNTLAASEYGLLDHNGFTPRPSYWAALLWHRLMGRTVLDAGEPQPTLHLYAHCLPEHAGGVTLLAINPSRTTASSIDLATRADRYTLSDASLESGRVQLNGRPLALDAHDQLPRLDGEHIASSGRVAFAPATITFLAFPDAGNDSCR